MRPFVFNLNDKENLVDLNNQHLIHKYLTNIDAILISSMAALSAVVTKSYSTWQSTCNPGVVGSISTMSAW